MGEMVHAMVDSGVYVPTRIPEIEHEVNLLLACRPLLDDESACRERKAVSRQGEVTVMGEVVHAMVDLEVDVPTRMSEIEHEVNLLLAADRC